MAKPLKVVLMDPIEVVGNAVFSRIFTPGWEGYALERKDMLILPKGGMVLFKWRTDSPKHGQCYEEWDDPSTAEQEDVPGRDHIQIHKANWPDELLGCIALGRAIMDIKRKDGTMERGVSSSDDACKSFANHMERATFKLIINRKEAV